MATTVARLQALLTADTRDFDQAMSKSEGKTDSFGSKLGSLGKAGVLAAGAAGVGALVYTLKTGIGEWQQSQKVAAQTQAVIKSTGGAAHVTAGQVSDLATSLMKKSGVDDEAIASGENMLLTFTNIRDETGKGNDVFKQATSTLLDMSTALGTDMNKSAIQLGKALNDPVKGITALQRVGVTFTAGQKDQIKAMVDSGHTMEAQKTILKELNKEFGGSAEALGNTLPGKINIVKESFNNWAGDLVGKLIPVLEKMADWAQKHWPEIQGYIEQFWASVKPILANLGDLVATTVGLFAKHWGTIKQILDPAVQVIKDAAAIIAGALKLVTDILSGNWSQAWKDAKQLVVNMITGIKDVILEQTAVLRLVMVKLGEKLKDGVVEGLTGIGQAAWGVINNIGEWVVNKTDAIVGWGEHVARSIKTGVVSGLAGIGEGAWSIINNIGEWIGTKAATIAAWGERIGKGILDGITSTLAGIGRGIGNLGASIGTEVVNGVKTALNGVIDWINNHLRIHLHIPIPFHKDFDFDWSPNIPELDTGGTVAQTGVAVIHKGETVVPGSNGTAVFNLQIGGEQIAQVVFDMLRNQAAVYQQANARKAF